MLKQYLLGLSLVAGLLAAPAAAQVDLSAITTEKVVYQQIGGTSLALVYVLPRGGVDRPAIVWLHGGGWSGGSPTQFMPQAQVLASKGVVSVLVQYRLAGEAPFPACVHDAKAAVRYVRAHAAQYKIDPKRIGVGGGSAGGHLAALVGLSPGKLEGDGPSRDVSSRPDLMILFNPVLDLRGWGESPMVQKLMGTATPSAEQLAAASPISYVSAQAPPALVLHGDQDQTVPYQQAVSVVESLQKAGVQAELFTAEGKGHGWFNRGMDFLTTLQRVLDFLQQQGYVSSR